MDTMTLDYVEKSYEDTQTKIIALILLYPNLLDSVKEKEECFDDKYQRIIQGFKAGFGSTTSNYRLWLQEGQKLTPIEIAAYTNIYNKCTMQTAFKDNPENIKGYFLKLEEKVKTDKRKEACQKLRDKDYEAGLAELEALGEDTSKVVECLDKLEPAVEVPDHEPVKQTRVIDFDLQRFPQRVQDFVNSISDQNRVLSSIFHLPLAYSVFATLIGKRMYCENELSIIYPNIWNTGITYSGSNKSASINATKRDVNRLSRQIIVPKATMAGLFLAMGKNFSTRQWQEWSPEQRETEIRNAENLAYSNLNGALLIPDECTGALQSLMGGWDSRNPLKDMSDFNQITDSNIDLDHSLIGGGRRIIFDMCLSFFGMTQNKIWQEAFGSDQFKDSGAFGRFVPYTDRYLKLVGLNAPTASYSSIIHDVWEAGKSMDGKIKCTFGDKPENGPDFIRQEMNEMEKYDLVKRFKDVYPNEWFTIKNKIIPHAIKASMVDAFLNGDHIVDQSPVATVDCSQYFALHAELITVAYFCYFEQVETKTEIQTLQEAILQKLKQYGALSFWDIKTYIRARYPDNLKFALENLLRYGKIVRVQSNNKRGPKTDKYMVKGN